MTHETDNPTPGTSADHDGKPDLRSVEVLYRVNGFISAVANLHQLLELIMSESKKSLACEACSLMLYNEEKHHLHFEVAQGPGSDAVKRIVLRMDQGIAGSCASQRKTQVVEDVSHDSRHFKGADEKSQFETRNILAVPMVRNERLIGVLELLNKTGGQPFSTEDIRLAEFIGAQAAIAIENAILIQEKVQVERLAATGVAVTGIAHYIKNILSSWSASAKLIEMALSADKYNAVKEAWPILLRANGKISTLVQDMLTYSKRREPEWEEGDLNQLYQEIHDSQLDRARDLGVVLTIDLDPAVTRSWFDPKAMTDTLLNLATNAVEACQQKEGAGVTLSTRFLPDEDEFRIVMQDNGPGIPADIRERIFEPFYSTKGSKGTGLGLALARKTVEEHGGRLDLQSEVGEGTTFSIFLPCLKQPPIS